MSKLEIYACSGVGDVISPSRVAQSIEDSGWMKNETLRKYLGTSNDGGCAEYFLYIFIPQSELGKYNATIYKKRMMQLKTFAYVRELFVGHNYGTEAEMISIIRKGIESTFGMTVEDVLAAIRNGNKDSIGEPISVAVASIITAVISAVVAIIAGIIQYCQNVNVAKYTAPTNRELEDSVPASTDFLGTSKKKGALLAAIAAACVLVCKLIKN